MDSDFTRHTDFFAFFLWLLLLFDDAFRLVRSAGTSAPAPPPPLSLPSLPPKVFFKSPSNTGALLSAPYKVDPCEDIPSSSSSEDPSKSDPEEYEDDEDEDDPEAEERTAADADAACFATEAADASTDSSRDTTACMARGAECSGAAELWRNASRGLASSHDSFLRGFPCRQACMYGVTRVVVYIYIDLTEFKIFYFAFMRFEISEGV